MHGRRRAETKALKRDPKISAKLGKKATLWYQLQKELLKRRRENDEDTTVAATEATPNPASETLTLIENALSVNPDPLWLWNFRRDLVQSSSSFSWETEAALTQTALEGNPKAYGAWHYRKWCLTHVNTKENSILSNELALTQAFLQRDERNFHCWSYRRFVVSCLLHDDTAAKGVWQCEGMTCMGAQMGGGDALVDLKPPDRSILEAEWEFTESKIRDNFSNFSAFHYRSKLLPILKKDLRNEFATIDNAICTEPDDQTAWWYQSFLFEYASEANDLRELVLKTILPDHIALLRDLQEETDNKSKWVLLGLFKTLSFQGEVKDTRPEQRALLRTLEVVDSDRKMRYKHLLSQLMGSD